METDEASPGAAFRVGTPTTLFNTGGPFFYLERYSVTADGKRFLFALPLKNNTGPLSANIVQNVFEKARR